MLWLIYFLVHTYCSRGAHFLGIMPGGIVSCYLCVAMTHSLSYNLCMKFLRKIDMLFHEFKWKSIVFYTFLFLFSSFFLHFRCYCNLHMYITRFLVCWLIANSIKYSSKGKTMTYEGYYQVSMNSKQLYSIIFWFSLICSNLFKNNLFDSRKGQDILTMRHFTYKRQIHRQPTLNVWLMSWNIGPKFLAWIQLVSTLLSILTHVLFYNDLMTNLGQYVTHSNKTRNKCYFS